MIRRAFVIEKERLDNMLVSEKLAYFERMIEDMDDSELLCIYVNGFSEEETKVESVEINFDKEIEL